MRNFFILFLLTLSLVVLGGCRRRARYAHTGQAQTDLTLCPSGARCPAGTQCSRDAQGEVCLPVAHQQSVNQQQLVYCRKHHECMNGQRCTKWTSGVRACMGGGLVGAPCRKHSQCVHGLRCERRPTDNLPVCTDAAGNYMPAQQAPYGGQAQGYPQGQTAQPQAAPAPQPYPQAQPYPQTDQAPANPPAPQASTSQARRSDWDAATQGYPYCNSGIDCGHGTFCRDRGDGVKMCMGGGVTGAPCAVGTDCASGLFCKDRGDGLRLCMGKGDQNAPCSSGIDCNPGLFCKDRGDGLHLCM